jgi:predicted AAA+ superfamily ATPase
MTSKEIYITREIESWIQVQCKNYPILSIIGPRQSGKTKLIQKYFPHLPYYDLEETDNFKMISKDPNRFVRDKCTNGAIFDEFHYIPELTQILKTFADELLREANKEGKTSLPTRFILTGSHNYLFDPNIKETMTGRVAIIKLLPFTLQESGCTDAFEAMYKGGYPILYVNGQIPKTFFPNYVHNYIDKEVRNIHGIKDLLKFEEFMQICASLAGNFFDYETVGSALGMTRKKLDEWLMVLYSSYIVFFARGYNKSVMKQMNNGHKLYFYDTGLCASLMEGIKSAGDIQKDPDARGKLFENLVFSEVWKKNFIEGSHMNPAHFWNITGKGGYEIDMVMKRSGVLRAIEIKSSDTFHSRWFDNMQKHPDLVAAKKFVVYTGPTQDVEGGRALNFCDLDQLFLD